MVGWHHQFNGHEFEQILGHSKGQGSLVSCPWGCKESDTTYQLYNRQQHIDKKGELIMSRIFTQKNVNKIFDYVYIAAKGRSKKDPCYTLLKIYTIFINS